MPTEHTISIPGRLCLMGEHSDWAADYRLQNEAIPQGTALIIGLNQTITAVITAQPSSLTLHSALSGHLHVPMTDVLPLARTAGSPWRFAAAAAYLMSTRFTPTDGLSLRITESTLPAEKGFSSSAAICVLLARAYNVAYDLRLSIAAEMDFAFAAERITGSMCGRMDQIVAIGPARVARMYFDPDFVDYSLVRLPSTAAIFIVIADLGRRKDTKLILTSLHRAFPDTDDSDACRLRHYLGERNQYYVQSMYDALCKGDPDSLGKLMTAAQREFDEAATPFCPEQLTAPRLHEMLTDHDICPLVYGGKGVGSQGDGAVQFVARSKKAADQLVEILSTKLGGTPTIVTPGLEAEKWHTVEAVPQNASEKQAMKQVRRGRVTKAIIPTAGFGTRLFPASRAVRPKSLLPIIDCDGFAKPILLHLVEQAAAAGLTNVTIVTPPGAELEAVRQLFTPAPRSLWDKLKPTMREYAKRVEELGKVVHLVVQQTAEGFGHAVACGGGDHDMDEAFVVLLGDVVLQTQEGATRSCVQQVLDAFERNGGVSTIGVTQVATAEARAYGVVCTATPLSGAGESAEIAQLIEKPDAQQVTKLSRDGVTDVVLGPYAFSATMMRELKKLVALDQREGGEIQLTSAMANVMAVEGMRALRMAGDALDTGNAVEYAKTIGKMAARMKPMK